MPVSDVKVWVDRAEYVRRIEEVLDASGVCCVHGVAKVGKTILGSLVWQDRGKCVVRWIDAGSVLGMLDGLQQAALELKVCGPASSAGANEEDACVAVGKTVFEAAAALEIPILMVFDALPPEEEGPRGVLLRMLQARTASLHVLVTT